MPSSIPSAKRMHPIVMLCIFEEKTTGNRDKQKMSVYNSRKRNMLGSDTYHKTLPKVTHKNILENNVTYFVPTCTQTAAKMTINIDKT